MLVLPFLVIWFLTVISSNSANDLENSCQSLCNDEEHCEATKVDDVCYYLYTDKNRTWGESKALCNQRNLTMAKLHKEPPLEIDAKASIAKDVWLGGKSKNLEKWTFVNNVSLDKAYANSHRMIENGDDHNQCGVLTYTKNDNRNVETETNKDYCYKRHHFICRFRKYNNFNSFYISESSTNWYNARIRCKEFGGDLMYLHPMENIAILNTKLPISRNKTMFIGLTKKIWQWEDGNEILPSNWPTVGSRNLKEQCLMLDERGTKNAEDCNVKLNAFCSTNEKVNCNEENHLQEPGMDNYTLIIWILSGLLGLSLLINIIGVVFNVYNKCIKPKRRFVPRHLGIFDLDDVIDGLGHPIRGSSIFSTTPTPTWLRGSPRSDYMNAAHRTCGDYSTSWQRGYSASNHNRECSGFTGNRAFTTVAENGGEMTGDQSSQSDYQNVQSMLR